MWHEMEMGVGGNGWWLNMVVWSGDGRHWQWVVPRGGNRRWWLEVVVGVTGRDWE